MSPPSILPGSQPALKSAVDDTLAALNIRTQAGSSEQPYRDPMRHAICVSLPGLLPVIPYTLQLSCHCISLTGCAWQAIL